MVATFDIPFVDADTIFSPLYSLPAEADYPIAKTKENSQMVEALDSLGYSSRYFGRVMGSVYIFMILTTLGLLLMLVFLAIKSSFSCAKRLYDKLYETLLWNHIIRLVFEACIELTFVMILNTDLNSRIHEGSNLLELMDYVYTMLFNILICLGPFFIIIFYNYHFDKWEADVFNDTYGTLYEGL